MRNNRILYNILKNNIVCNSKNNKRIIKSNIRNNNSNSNSKSLNLNKRIKDSVKRTEIITARNALAVGLLKYILTDAPSNQLHLFAFLDDDGT